MIFGDGYVRSVKENKMFVNREEIYYKTLRYTPDEIAVEQNNNNGVEKKEEWLDWYITTTFAHQTPNPYMVACLAASDTIKWTKARMVLCAPIAMGLKQ